jgi:hypothetical protein
VNNPLFPNCLGAPMQQPECPSSLSVGNSSVVSFGVNGSKSSERRGPNNLAMNIDLTANGYHNLPDNQLTIMDLN